MSLTVQPIRQEYFSCIDGVVATMANFFGRPYTLMFLGYMGFKYSPQKIGAHTYADQLSYGIHRYSRYTLRQYHNIKVSWRWPGLYSVLRQVVQGELKRNRPVGVYLDSFYCPWNAAYQKFHIDHFVLIFGQDEQGQYICLDPYASETPYFLPAYLLKQGFGKYILFEAEAEQDITARMLPDILKENFYTRGHAPHFEKTCKSMKLFAEDIAVHLDMDLETREWQGDLQNTALFRKINTFGKNRTKFSISLACLGERFQSERTVDIAKQAAQLRQQWDHTNTLLLKFYFSQNPSLQNALREKLLSIAEEEHRIAWALIELAEKG